MGSTLQFTCTCNTGIHEEEEDSEEEFDIFKIDSVKVHNEKEGQSTYEAETETMDGVCRNFFSHTYWIFKAIHAFFISNTFSTQPQCLGDKADEESK